MTDDLAQLRRSAQQLRQLQQMTAGEPAAAPPAGLLGDADAPPTDDRDYTRRFNTELDAAGEQQFQQWLADRAATEGRDVGRDLYNYDLRGAWQSGATAAANGHLPDTFKKPNHITFSDQSRYHTPATPGGSWTPGAGDDGAWRYAPSPYVAGMHGRGELQRYFREHEPGNQLMFPGDDVDTSTLNF